MDQLTLFVKISVYALMAISVIAALGTVTLGNIFYAALCLVGVLIGTAGLYLALHADFLAIVQILLYVGAVMTLVIFSIMMTQRANTQNVKTQNNLRVPALMACIVFLIALYKLFVQAPWDIKAKTVAARLTTFDLGQALMSTYVFPFEVISVILIAVMIGALIVAKKD